MTLICSPDNVTQVRIANTLDPMFPSKGKIRPPSMKTVVIAMTEAGKVQTRRKR
jgi:hypothetical protein